MRTFVRLREFGRQRDQRHARLTETQLNIRDPAVASALNAFPSLITHPHHSKRPIGFDIHEGKKQCN